MVSSVKSLPNHYQTLGLLPTASESEIAQAFARAMSMFGARSFRSAAKIGLAFEVLRSAAKRREYDRSIGLVPEPTPDSSRWRIATPQSSRGFMGTAWTDLAKQVAGDESPSQPKSALQSRLESGAEPRVASFIASSLREPAISEAPKVPSAPRFDEKREANADAALERHLAQLLAVRNAQDESEFDGDVRAMEWKRPALLLGGLLLAAGMVGTMAGLWVQRGSDSAPPPKASLTIALPKEDAKPVIAPAAIAQPMRPEVQPRPVVHSTASVTSPKIIVPKQQQAPLPQEAATSPVPSSEQVQTASDELAATASAHAPVEAAMPLRKQTIARTIEKIGYSCGTVASITTAEGAEPGVFKVTCSSGQSYQATPVNGRYHFRKMGPR